MRVIGGRIADQIGGNCSRILLFLVSATMRNGFQAGNYSQNRDSGDLAIIRSLAASHGGIAHRGGFDDSGHLPPGSHGTATET